VSTERINALHIYVHGCLYILSSFDGPCTSVSTLNIQKVCTPCKGLCKLFFKLYLIPVG
jgi:hypothetical protein